MIQVTNLTRTYRVGEAELHALRSVSLSVERGEFVAIMGSSGSGKSTLLNILGCLDRPTEGQYLFEGTDLSKLSEPDRAAIRSQRIGFVFQSFNLLARTSALENVALPLFYAASGRANRPQRLMRARQMLRLLGLGEREHSSPNQLSGGQQQRVAIARALINEPTVLLADEPTGNLDTRTSHEIMATLRALNRDRGVTIVMVTHEPDIAAYADRKITMRDGQILSDEKVQTTPLEGGAPSPPLLRDIAAPLDRTLPDQPSAKFLTIAAASRLHWPFTIMILATAAQAIGRNKLRSALTALGVFIGVAALIAMVAVGQGANQAIKQQIESLGTNMLIVLPGATTTSGVRGGFGSASTLTVSDVDAIRREDSAVGIVSYMIRQLGQVEYSGNNWTTSVQGVTPNYFITANWRIAAGRALTRDDENLANMVCLIGQTVYQQLFRPGENPLGATILIKGMPVHIVGLLAGKGQSAFGQDQDDLLMIPFATAESKVLGVAAPSKTLSPLAALYPPPPNPYGTQPRLTGYVNLIFVQAIAGDQVQTALQQVTETLKRRHHIRPTDTRDFDVRNLNQIVEAAKGSSQIMALLLAIVASISLVVGGIGIMNILLVSVTERTREIGLRMAVGAHRLHVLLQFLGEAVLLSTTGGVAGILVGTAISALVSAVAHWPTLLPPVAVAGGFLFSAGVGIFFGFYPARKAAQLDPIEALRYE